jgi:gluconate 2-dehydrogenase gamma chain
LTSLIPRESAILDAFSARLIPSDDNGPGAREANVVRYIDLALAGDYRAHRMAYAEGLRAVDDYATATYGRGFCELTPREQDAVVAAVESGDVAGFASGSTAFFELLREHVLEGMFGDPAWGGNAGFVGWDLLGYTGIRPVWTEEDQQLDVVVPPAHTGLAELRAQNIRSPHEGS